MAPASAPWGPRAVGPGLPACSRAGAASFPSWGRKGSGNTPSMPAPWGGRAEGCVGHPSTAALSFLGRWAGGDGVRVGEGGPQSISTLLVKLRLFFSVLQIKPLCIYTHPTAQEVAWPHTYSVLPHRLKPGSCTPPQSHQTQAPGAPQGWVHQPPCPSQCWSQPGPKSTCNNLCTHFQGEDPPKHPKPPRR